MSLNDQPYTLILGHSPDARESELDGIRAAAKPMLRGANIVWRNLSLSELAEFDPSLETSATSPPGLWLSSPSGETRLVTRFDQGLPTAKQLADVVTSLIDSPSHHRLLEQTIRCHSVLLLVECDSESENATAASAAKEAIRVTLENRDSWDKPISEAPQLMVIHNGDPLVAACKSVELQSNCKHPQVVVLYGRGAVLGSVLTGEEITANALRKRLDLLGRDCECEMDRSLLTGLTIPHRWTASHERAAAKELGFDPGSPVVVSEVRSIVLRQSTSSEQKILLDARPLAGYQEFDLSGLDSDETQPDKHVAAKEAEAAASKDSAPKDSGSEDSEAPLEDVSFSDIQSSASPYSFSSIFLTVILLIAAISVAAGGSIFFRSKLRQQ